MPKMCSFKIVLFSKTMKQPSIIYYNDEEIQHYFSYKINMKIPLEKLLYENIHSFKVQLVQVRSFYQFMLSVYNASRFKIFFKHFTF